MKKIKIIWAQLPVGLFLLFLASCTKNLDQTPISSISTASFWKTPADANGGLYGMYSAFRTQAASNYYIFGELRSEIMGTSALGTAGYEIYFNQTLNSTNVSPSYNGNITTWQNLYSVVNDANLLLKYIPKIDFPVQATRNSILAQAYSMRAWVYFTMVKTWGDVVVHTTPIEAVDSSIQQPRTDKEIVFQLIKKDIDSAVSLFPDNTYPKGRDLWSLPAVNALKADVYLWTGKVLNGGAADFSTALDACNAAATGSASLLPKFTDIFDYANKGNAEIVMAAHLQNLESVTSIYQFMTLAPNGQLTPPNIDSNARVKLAGLAGYTYLSPSPLVTSQFTADDQRTAASFVNVYTISPGGDSTFYVCVPIKFRGYTGFGAYDDIIIYRYADVLLMKAEAENALNQDPSAEMNMIRQRAYGTNFSTHVFVSGTQAENDSLILKERLLELIFEGKRWWDLIRFGQAFNLVPALKAQPTADYLLLWPISLSTLSIEPKIQQNPGY